jgi:RsiW-degrading membrane proteinase PrsW (M82 family)
MTKIKFLFAGLAAAVLALVLETIFLILFSPDASEKILIESFRLMILVALLEEFSKFLILGKIIFPCERSRVFLNAILFGIGFSVFEILFNSIRLAEISGGIILSYLAVTLLHVVTALIIAFFIRSYPKTLGLFLASALHLSFNVAISNNLSLWKIIFALSAVIFALCLLFLPKKKLSTII